jgi:hypothetical protein
MNMIVACDKCGICIYVYNECVLLFCLFTAFTFSYPLLASLMFVLGGMRVQHIIIIIIIIQFHKMLLV